MGKKYQCGGIFALEWGCDTESECFLFADSVLKIIDDNEKIRAISIQKCSGVVKCGWYETTFEKLWIIWIVRINNVSTREHKEKTQK